MTPRAWTLPGLALALVLITASAYWAAPAPLSDTLEPDTAADPAPDHIIQLNLSAIPCPPGYDNEHDDDVCLGYADAVPGPTWIFHEGDEVEITLAHNVTSSIQETEAGDELAEELSQARYSHHRHGVATANCHDGIAQPEATLVCDSTVGPPGADKTPGEITYRFTTPFPGAWHYHDHALGVDAGVVHEPVIGEEGAHRGLFGAFLVLEQGETTDNVFDLHMLDAGPNGGLGLDETVQAGDRFDVIVTGLGDWAWTVTLEDPSGTVVDTAEVGPGVSRGLTVHEAQAGSYVWTAQSPTQPGTFEGEVVAS